jgi:hypothetical protein
MKKGLILIFLVMFSFIYLSGDSFGGGVCDYIGGVPGVNCGSGSGGISNDCKFDYDDGHAISRETCEGNDIMCVYVSGKVNSGSAKDNCFRQVDIDQDFICEDIKQTDQCEKISKCAALTGTGCVAVENLKKEECVQLSQDECIKVERSLGICLFDNVNQVCEPYNGDMWDSPSWVINLQHNYCGDKIPGKYCEGIYLLDCAYEGPITVDECTNGCVVTGDIIEAESSVCNAPKSNVERQECLDCTNMGNSWCTEEVGGVTCSSAVDFNVDCGFFSGESVDDALNCPGSSNSITAACGPAVNAQPGSPNLDDLCSSGSASEVIETGGIDSAWSWSCMGTNGVEAYCITPDGSSNEINGVCGVATNVEQSSTPDEAERCLDGIANDLIEYSDSYSWSCEGIDAQSNDGGAYCSSNQITTNSCENKQSDGFYCDGDDRILCHNQNEILKLDCALGCNEGVCEEINIGDCPSGEEIKCAGSDGYKAYCADDSTFTKSLIPCFDEGCNIGESKCAIQSSYGFCYDYETSNPKPIGDYCSNNYKVSCDGNFGGVVEYCEIGCGDGQCLNEPVETFGSCAACTFADNYWCDSGSGSFATNPCVSSSDYSSFSNFENSCEQGGGYAYQPGQSCPSPYLYSWKHGTSSNTISSTSMGENVRVSILGLPSGVIEIEIRRNTFLLDDVVKYFGTDITSGEDVIIPWNAGYDSDDQDYEAGDYHFRFRISNGAWISTKGEKELTVSNFDVYNNCNLCNNVGFDWCEKGVGNYCGFDSPSASLDFTDICQDSGGQPFDTVESCIVIPSCGNNIIDTDEECDNGVNCNDPGTASECSCLEGYEIDPNSNGCIPECGENEIYDDTLNQCIVDCPEGSSYDGVDSCICDTNKFEFNPITFVCEPRFDTCYEKQPGEDPNPAAFCQNVLVSPYPSIPNKPEFWEQAYDSEDLSNCFFQTSEENPLDECCCSLPPQDGAVYGEYEDIDILDKEGNIIS